MSPSLATIQAATPKCPGAHTNVSTLGGIAGQIPCGRPMLWDAMAEQWRCVTHGTRAFETGLWEAA
jgi:hypothetical protein